MVEGNTFFAVNGEAEEGPVVSKNPGTHVRSASALCTDNMRNTRWLSDYAALHVQRQLELHMARRLRGVERVVSGPLP